MSNHVYVDQLRGCRRCVGWRWQTYCHLFADVGSLDYLHEFAGRLGLRRAWFQVEDGRMPHYDLNARKRQWSVALGAIEVGMAEVKSAVAAWRRWWWREKIMALNRLYDRNCGGCGRFIVRLRWVVRGTEEYRRGVRPCCWDCDASYE